MSLPFHVRHIIPYIEYGNVSNMIPKEKMFTNMSKGGKFPKIVKKMGYSPFGLFVDHTVRIMLCNGTWEEFIKNYYDKFGISYSDDEWYYTKLLAQVDKFFGNSKHISIEPEWIYNYVQGHPDLVIDGVIIDIKTTGNFNAMRTDCIKQILTYYCLAKKLKILVHSVGLFLPAQNLLLTYRIDNWNWKKYWKYLKNTCIRIYESIPTPEQKTYYIEHIQSHVGFHYPKSGTVFRTLEPLRHTTTRAWQIFLAGRTNANFKITDTDIDKTAKLVLENSMHIYVHSAYTINLSRRYEDNWIVTVLIKYLQKCNRMNFRGVVVHCGKVATMKIETAYNNMLANVNDLGKYATRNCPLLIETSAGQKGELLSHPDEMVKFYKSLEFETQQVTQICVDTCHVFSAGHKPMDYINKLVSNDIPIRLIHYNDSQMELGCCKDRHARIGSGCIPLSQLIDVGKFAIRNDIDMVHE